MRIASFAVVHPAVFGRIAYFERSTKSSSVFPLRSSRLMRRIATVTIEVPLASWAPCITSSDGYFPRSDDESRREFEISDAQRIWIHQFNLPRPRG